MTGCKPEITQLVTINSNFNPPNEKTRCIYTSTALIILPTHYLGFIIL